MSRSDAVLVGLWSGLVAVGFYLQPFLGLVLAVAILAAFSWRHYEAQKQIYAETGRSAFEAGLRVSIDAQTDKLDKLVEQFTNLRADDAQRRTQAGAVPRLRG